MTQANARIAANVVLGLAGVAAAYVVWTTPPLRRVALRAARVWLAATIPGYVLAQAHDAWVESGRSA